MKIVFVLLMLLSLNLSAQIKITGKIITSAEDPIEFAQAVLIAKDSTVIKNEFTNEKGIFELEINEGWYRLEIRKERKILFSKNIELNADLNMGIITIDHVNQLEEVSIEAKRKLFERKVDRLIFNVENSINASGGDALDALKVTPGVRIQNEKISIVGKNNLAIMIDDKIIEIPQEDLVNFLKSIPSESIKSIEVITTPPAKYEAAGNSGMVNIRLKKIKKDSWNALMGITYLQRKYDDGAFLGNLNYNKNKVGVSSIINYKNGTTYVEQNSNVYFPDGLWRTSNPFKSQYNRINGRVNVNYIISPKWVSGVQFLINDNIAKASINSYTSVNDFMTDQTISYLKSDRQTVQKPNIKSLNFYNEFKLDTLGKKIELNLDFFNYNNKDSRIYNGISVIEIPTPPSEKYFSGINNNNQNIDNLSGKIDVEFPFEFMKLNFGGKISNSRSNNNIFFFNSGVVNQPISELSLSQSKFEYTENVEAIYVSGNIKINKKWELQLGLRSEAIQTKAFSENLNQLAKNNYFKLFPTTFLSYVPNENSIFSFSYSKRIERPRFNELNPNVFYINPFQTIEGNPFLQPAFIDNIELTYTYKKFESKFYYSIEDNLFYQIPITDPNANNIKYTNENFIDTQRYGISENYVYDRYKRWTSSINFDINYSISKSSLTITNREQKGVNSRISLNNDFSLNPSETLLFNMNYWYNFPSVDGIEKNRAISSLSSTLQYLLLKKDLKLSLKINDLFKTEVIQSNSTVNGIYQEARYYLDCRGVQLSVNYKFGNKTVKEQQRQMGNEEEKRRTGI
ncbi:TonB-dependent receptor domain-containing protein [Flavobacterium sp. LHD-85]|uniref:TonB-dependent receptor domain-containing protein n=1 Tax=Flavobacterium sp. LHD-85 TaxID=3071410 RepID=UPI0027E061A6|nr:TonB-dependent receptor [Flavobacterium sp. LHD-85]MDQ6531234.1 TonB-dependent receptor [Flavobacterium sp. LHD-85]